MTQSPSTPPHHSQERENTNTLAIVALVCGIIGCVFFPAGLVALICGIMALSKSGPAAMKGRGFALTGTILGGVAIVAAPIVLLLAAILLPALGAARRTAQRMQNSTQLRGIHQGMVTYANSNKNQFPGLDSRGEIVVDSQDTGFSGDGSTPQARMWMLINGDFFTPEYMISPSETEPISLYPYGSTAPMQADHYSYSLLSIIDPDSGRRGEWSQTLNTQAVVVSDRNTGPSVSSPQSVHSGSDPWVGSVLWNDNHVAFEQTHVFETRYGSAPLNRQDDIFVDETQGDDALMVHDTP